MSKVSASEGTVRLAIDLSSGDHGAAVTVPAVLEILRSRPDVSVVLVGTDADAVAVSPLEAFGGRARFERAESVLPSDVGPATALRQAAGSTLGRALQLVAEGKVEASVSAGSTTALMALGRKTPGMLPGLKRPALMTEVPSTMGSTSLLDLGANLNVDAVQLVQFAIMGAVARKQQGGAEPTVGLLNVGHEDRKGHSVVREAHEMLKRTPLDYRGFIEGNDIFLGAVDVAVCDGFAGNLVLKSSEGLATMLLGSLKESLAADARARLGAWLAAPALRSMVERFDPAQHNGAPLLGLNGIVVKSHGSAGRAAMVQAMLVAVDEVARKVPEKIRTLIKNDKAEQAT